MRSHASKFNGCLRPLSIRKLPSGRLSPCATGTAPARPTASAPGIALRRATMSSIARQIHLMEDIVARLRAIPGAEEEGLDGADPVAQGDNITEGNFLILYWRRQ